MERLVFNTAEHKLEELEKYGFIEVNGSYRILSEKSVMPSERCFIKKHYAIIIFKNGSIQIGGVKKDNIYVVLYDLVKDGLVVKEKQNDKN